MQLGCQLSPPPPLQGDGLYVCWVLLFRPCGHKFKSKLHFFLCLRPLKGGAGAWGGGCYSCGASEKIEDRESERLMLRGSVTRKKSPNVYKSCPKIFSQEKWMALTHLQKLPKNVRDLDKLIVSKGFEKLPKVQKSPNLVTLLTTVILC